MSEIIFRMQEIKPIGWLYANDYNPNRMPDIEMGLLGQCIKEYGFLFPIIATSHDDNGERGRIIDGFHRYEKLKNMGSDKASVIDLNIPFHQAVQLTVLMNRIKGMHQVERMSDLVVKLEDLGLEDHEICQNLGMEAEEFLRLKQQLGIAHAFRNHHYSKSWEAAK